MRSFFLFILLLISLAGMAQVERTFVVHFDFDSYHLTNDAKAALDSFIATENSAYVKGSIALSGHCDHIGSNEYNDKLSDQRINSVKDYLVKNNIPSGIVEENGHGKRKPLNNNGNDRERMLNRRVEITITSVAEQPQKTTVTEIPDVPLNKGEDIKLKERFADTATKVGSKIVLKNLHFIGARHQLLPQSFPVLEELLEIMKTNATLNIEIQGHICCMPGNIDGVDAETGQSNLSLARARAIWEYLIENGIEKSRVSYIGLGHSYPIYPYPEKTAAQETANRRVEIRIISK